MDLIRNLLPGEITFAISLAGLIYQKGFARERLAEQLRCRPPGIPPFSVSLSLSFSPSSLRPAQFRVLSKK